MTFREVTRKALESEGIPAQTIERFLLYLDARFPHGLDKEAAANETSDRLMEEVRKLYARHVMNN